MARLQELAFARENRDIGLSLGLPQYQVGSQALAGMMDMLGLDRGRATGDQLPESTGMTPTGYQYTPDRLYLKSPSYWKGSNDQWLEAIDAYYTDPDAFGTDTALADGTTIGELSKKPKTMIEYVNNRLGGRKLYTDAGDTLEDYRYIDPQTGLPTAGASGGGIGGAPGDSLAGYREAGDLSGYDQFDWQQTPSYQFRLDEGMRALENSAAAGAGILNGGFVRDAIGYGQDMATLEYDNIYNRLAGLAGMGQTAANVGAGVATGVAGQSGADFTAAAGAYRGAGTLGGANAWATGINELGRLGGQINWGGGGGGTPGQEYIGAGTGAAWDSFRVPGFS